MSTTFSIACKDEITVPAVSKPFDVTIENFERDFKETFEDAEKLQSFVQTQVDEKFAAATANSRDRDHARAENPKVSVEGGDVAVFTVTFVWQNNDDASNVATVEETWKVDMKTKEVVGSSSAQQQQEAAATPAAATTTTTSAPAEEKKTPAPAPSSTSAPAATTTSTTSASSTSEQQQQQQKEALPTAAVGPSPTTPAAEEKKEGGCVIQ